MLDRPRLSLSWISLELVAGPSLLATSIHSRKHLGSMAFTPFASQKLRSKCHHYFAQSNSTLQSTEWERTNLRQWLVHSYSESFKSKCFLISTRLAARQAMGLPSWTVVGKQHLREELQTLRLQTTKYFLSHTCRHLMLRSRQGRPSLVQSAIMLQRSAPSLTSSEECRPIAVTSAKQQPPHELNNLRVRCSSQPNKIKTSCRPL